MHLAVTNIDTQLRRDFFGNNFNIKGGCGGGVKVQDRLLGSIRFHHAFITMDDSQQTIAQLFFH